MREGRERGRKLSVKMTFNSVPATKKKLRMMMTMNYDDTDLKLWCGIWKSIEMKKRGGGKLRFGKLKVDI